MPSIAAAVAQIQLAVAPVVFLDTCVLLDVVRAPLRNSARVVQAASELLTGAQRNPPTIHLVVACPTPTEWTAHIDEVVENCATAVSCVSAVAESWAFLGFLGLPTLPPAALLLPDRLRKLSKDLLDAAILLDKDGDALSRAIDRVIGYKLPVKKEGKGAKDAVILEHAIQVTKAIRAVPSTQTCIFVSSNTADFAIPKTTTLHPLLKPDFDPPTNLQYAASLSAAVAVLKIGGWVP